MMFEDEKLEDGITLSVYRFEALKPVLSIKVRMVGEKTAKVHPLVVALRKSLKLHNENKLKGYKLEHPKRWYKKPTEEEIKEMSFLVQKANGDSLFDIPLSEGEIVLNKLVEDIKATGLTLKPPTRRSNGELDEEIYHFV